MSLHKRHLEMRSSFCYLFGS